MSDKLIESFLKYEEQRKAKKSPNEFHNVKNLQEKVTRKSASFAVTNESIEFSEAELAHFKSILEAMPVAPTAEGHGPNPTPKNKAEGGKGRGSLSEKMDPVGEEDKDVNNDGEENTDSDKYLRRRRDAIADNMKKKNK